MISIWSRKELYCSAAFRDNTTDHSRTVSKTNQRILTCIILSQSQPNVLDCPGIQEAGDDGYAFFNLSE